MCILAQVKVAQPRLRTTIDNLNENVVRRDVTVDDCVAVDMYQRENYLKQNRMQGLGPRCLFYHPLRQAPALIERHLDKRCVTGGGVKHC